MKTVRSAKGIGTEWRGRSYLAWLALACSTLLTVGAWHVSANSVTARLRDQFTVRTGEIARAIEQRMLSYEAVLQGGVALFLASNDVSRREFGDFFRYLEVRRFYPGIQGIGYAKLVSERELEPLVQRVRAEGFYDYQVRPLGHRARYAPVVYIEPFDARNQRAFGYDMYAEPNRRSAMERAGRLGRSSASAIVTLMQEMKEDPQSGFLLYLPIIYRHTVSPRRLAEGLDGFVYGAFRVRDLMQGILGDEPAHIDFAVYEGNAARSFYDTRTAPSPRAALSRRRDLAFAGQHWTLRFWSQPSYGSWISRNEPLWVLLAGVVLNLLLFYIVGSGASIQRRARRLAQEMTNELTRSHAREQSQMLASLREKETLLKEIHHRVKNNLQVVSSLLSLQQSHTADPGAVDVLQQSRDRVLAMAALHEFLYQSNDLSRVDTKAYLSHLVTILTTSYRSSRPAAIDVALDVEDVPLDLDQAIPCGLITNELVTNAYKYAFRDRTSGRLTVGLHLRDGKIVLAVGDDGPGLPEAVDAGAPTTLGLQLVQMLSEQLGGVVQILREPGTRFVITFPYHTEQAAT